MNESAQTGPPHADPRQDQVFFGREEELYQLVRLLRHGRHAILLGDKGIGKSRLMLEARQILSGHVRRVDFSSVVVQDLTGNLARRIRPFVSRTLIVEHPVPLGECLKEMAEQLFHHGNLHFDFGESGGDWSEAKKNLRGMGSVKLQAVILESMSAACPPYLIFLDNLDRISPSQQAFIESLLNVAVICTSAVQTKNQFIFKRIWSSFARIELGPLPESVCIRLVDYFLDNYPVHAIDRDMYRREILKAANGNPFQIKNLIWHGTRLTNLDATEIRSLRRVEDGPYFNMGPLYIFGAGAFTLFKIFSLGTDNREFYIYFSALGFLVFLTFRIFRMFFLFRPQRYK